MGLLVTKYAGLEAFDQRWDGDLSLLHVIRDVLRLCQPCARIRLGGFAPEYVSISSICVCQECNGLGVLHHYFPEHRDTSPKLPPLVSKIVSLLGIAQTLLVLTRGREEEMVRRKKRSYGTMHSGRGGHPPKIS